MAEARFAAKAEAVCSALEAPELPVEVIARPVQSRGPLADPGAHYPVVKAVVDGLRDAGILPDDTGAEIVRLTQLAPRKKRGDEGEGLEISLRSYCSADAATRAGLFWGAPLD